ncbi:hypothetical protein AGDE_04241 [Angomonas deanei]|uniref:Uncharacterized protein n=1 Tax=Angomonas deanei TaxID=59799 RepID=A0A7G2C0H5_9TRYP|nr:hypothetical protein AGDE_04241 [Angomonas deanei]CAD2213189.1 hypothetical protein, conserved [Angomonas deanei]|eukprot:EPY39687.1 hypothetical protein AGDE_04241 [Angomonas deanei]
MRKWNVLLRDEQTTTCFDRNFRDFFRGADPHSRCVILKALTTEGGLLEKYETFVVEYMQQDIPLLSPEDIESILNVVLKMKRREEIESVMDIVGTRLLPLLPQCKRSTLIRTLQCCGAFQINDSELIQRVLATLEDQCVGQHSHGVNLNAAQLFTLLNAIEKLNISSEKSAEQLVIFSFMSIRRQLGVLSIQQVAEAARLAVSLEMGFTVYISDIVTKLLEFRDTNKNPQVAEAVVAVCSVYRVEAPQPMVINKLRKQKIRTEPRRTGPRSDNLR